jgi:hypothetical protein
VAIVLPKFSDSRSSTTRTLVRRTDPAIALRLLTLQPALEPGEELEFDYKLLRMTGEQVDALEISVMWYTEGKGSEDIGVHLFQRLTGDELGSLPFDVPRKLVTALPASPLSYEGKLLKIRWCIRMRLFLTSGKEVTAQKTFYLGHLTVEV